MDDGTYYSEDIPGILLFKADSRPISPIAPLPRKITDEDLDLNLCELLPPNLCYVSSSYSNVDNKHKVMHVGNGELNVHVNKGRFTSFSVNFPKQPMSKSDNNDAASPKSSLKLHYVTGKHDIGVGTLNSNFTQPGSHFNVVFENKDALISSHINTKHQRHRNNFVQRKKIIPKKFKSSKNKGKYSAVNIKKFKSQKIKKKYSAVTIKKFKYQKIKKKYLTKYNIRNAIPNNSQNLEHIDTDEVFSVGRIVSSNSVIHSVITSVSRLNNNSHLRNNFTDMNTEYLENFSCDNNSQEFQSNNASEQCISIIPLTSNNEISNTVIRTEKDYNSASKKKKLYSELPNDCKVNQFEHIRSKDSQDNEIIRSNDKLSTNNVLSSCFPLNTAYNINSNISSNSSTFEQKCVFPVSDVKESEGEDQDTSTCSTIDVSLSTAELKSILLTMPDAKKSEDQDRDILSNSPTTEACLSSSINSVNDIVTEEDSVNISEANKLSTFSNLSTSNRKCTILPMSDGKESEGEDQDTLLTIEDSLLNSEDGPIVIFYCSPLHSPENKRISSSDENQLVDKQISAPKISIMDSSCQRNLLEDKNLTRHAGGLINDCDPKLIYENCVDENCVKPVELEEKKNSMKNKNVKTKKFNFSESKRNIIDGPEEPAADVHPIVVVLEEIKKMNVEDIKSNYSQFKFHVNSLINIFIDPTSSPNTTTVLFHTLKHISLSKLNPLLSFMMKKDYSVFCPIYEKTLIEAFIEVDDKAGNHLKKLVESAVVSLNYLILDKKSISKTGLAAFSRIYTNLCKEKKNNKPLKLCGDLLKRNHPFGILLIYNIIGAWKELFIPKPQSKEYEVLFHSVVAYGVQKNLTKYTSNEGKIYKNVFLDFMVTPATDNPVKAVKIALKNLEKLFNEKPTENDFLYVEPIVILSAIEGAKWAWENAVKTFVLPSLLKFSQKTENERAFSILLELYAEIGLHIPEDRVGAISALLKFFNMKNAFSYVKPTSAVFLTKLAIFKRVHLFPEVMEWIRENEKSLSGIGVESFMKRQLISDDPAFTEKDIFFKC